MTNTPDKIEVLDLPEPARTLFRKTRNALDTYVSPYTADGEGYKLGGGTVLAARWIHRNSEDIDLFCHPDTESAHFQTDLADALKRAGGTPIAWGEWSRINFGKNHLDLAKRQPVPAVGHKTAIVDGKPATVLTNVQILNGKLLNRALDPPVRDVYDVAVCGIEDSISLEIAVNGIYEAAIDSRILGWKMNREKHAEYAAEQILYVPTRLQTVKAKPAQYAIRAAERALYYRVTIAADRGLVHVRTNCAEASRTRSYRNASELEVGFETAGINNFLRAHGKNPRVIRQEATAALNRDETAVLLELKPRLPPTRQEDLRIIPRMPQPGDQAPEPAVSPSRASGSGSTNRCRSNDRTR